MVLPKMQRSHESLIKTEGYSVVYFNTGKTLQEFENVRSDSLIETLAVDS